MPDLNERLARLADTPSAQPTEAIIRADMLRGARAARRRRTRQYAIGSCVAGMTLIATSVVATRAATDSPPTAAGSVSPPSSISRVQLVDYHGPQRPGFRVARVPAGYVLQGVNENVLAVARAGDKSPLNYLGGKLVVMLESVDAPPTQPDGISVKVNGHSGVIWTPAGADGKSLRYRDGKYPVLVQSDSAIRLTDAQLVTFAEGVTVLPHARRGQG